MKTKSLLLTISIISISALSLFAQEEQKISFAARAGINFQNLTGKDVLGNDLTNSLTTGFHAGANVIIPLAPDIYFQPGLLFSQKGAKNTGGSETVKYKINYLDLPLNLLYRSQLGQGYVLLGFGPYVAYALNGKVKTGDTEMNLEFTSTVDANDPAGTTYMKSFDAGAGVFAGYETGFGLYLQLNTQLGLIKVNPADDRVAEDNASMKNVGFGLSLGYRF